MPRLCIVPARVLEDPEVGFPHLRALLAIGQFTDRSGGNVWASNATLAEKARIDKRDLRRILHDLQERGYIRRVRRWRTDGSDTTSLIEILLDAPAGGEGADTPEDGCGTPWEDGCEAPEEGAGTPGEVGRGTPREEGWRTPREEGWGTPQGEGRPTPPNDPVKRPTVTGINNSSSGGGVTPHTFAEPLYQQTYAEILAEVPNPSTFDAAVRGLLQGLGARGMRPVPEARLGQAILDMRVAGASPTPVVLRGFVKKLEEEEQREKESATAAARPTTTRGGQPDWDQIVRNLKARGVDQ